MSDNKTSQAVEVLAVAGDSCVTEGDTDTLKAILKKYKRMEEALEKMSIEFERLDDLYERLILDPNPDLDLAKTTLEEVLSYDPLDE